MRRLLAALGVTALLVTPALAEDPSPSPTLAPEAPLRVSVTDLLPRAPSPGDAFQVFGTLTNTGDQPISGITLRLRVGDRIDSRGALHEADTDRPPTERRTGTRLALPDTLAPGAQVAFDLRTTVAALGLGRLGVYPLDVEARGDVGDGDERLGLAPTWVPWFAGDPVARTRVAVVWPLVDRPRQAVDGTFTDDVLATSLAPSGRLGGLLAAAQLAAQPDCGRPARRPDGTVTPRPTRCEAVPVTYAVDPDLLVAAKDMADGYRVDGQAGPVAGEAAAKAFLAALKDAAARARVLALPYADPDVTALARLAGAASDVDLPRAAQLGESLVRDQLGVDPLQGVAFPPAGSFTKEAADALARTGAREFVLDQSAYGQPDSEPSPIYPTRALLPVTDLGEPAEALVTEPYLSDLVSGDLADELGPRLAEQRFLVETAMIAAEAPASSRTLVITPERRGTVSPVAAGAALRDLGRLPWLCPVTLEAVVADAEHCSDRPATDSPVAVQDRGPLATGRTELAGSYLRAVGADRDVADQLTGQVLSDQPGDQQRVAAVTTSLRRGLARAESSAWREDPRTARAQAAALHRHLQDQVEKVTVYGGQVLLTSTAGRLQVSLENRLDVPIRVHVRFEDAARVFEPVETGLIEVSGGNAVPAAVRAETRKSGQYIVNAVVYDRAGRPFPDSASARRTELIVRSTGFGRLALAVTLGGAGVLFVAAGVRVVRRALGRTPPASPPADA